VVLTYIADFFKRLGFKEINKEDIPEHKIWMMYKVYPFSNLQ